MRYDTPIFFQRIVSGEYDYDTGDYAEDTVEETKVFASVAATRAETMNLVYHEIRQGSVTVHIPRHFREPFDRVRIGKSTYRVDYRRPLRHKETFVLSEVQ